jgi:O-antigen ligase
LNVLAPTTPARGVAPWTIAVTLAAVAWGALSFGAVYPWAYWPLAAACLAAGVAGLLAQAPRPRIVDTAGVAVAPIGVSRGLRVALILIGSVPLLQLVPLPRSWLEHFSPGTIDILQALDPAFAARLIDTHAISVDPSVTLVSFALYAALSLFLLGLTRLLSLTGTRRLTEGLAAFAVLLAMSGIVYKPPVGGRVYGFWQPYGAGDPFGPFVNRNHFAGWMLLALPVTLGLLCSAIEHGGRVRPGWRSRLLWLSTPEASRLILLAGAAVVMALSLVMTMSRSGISALLLALLITSVVILRNEGSRWRKVIGVTYLLVLVVSVAAWVGPDAIVRRFSTGQEHDLNLRTGAWMDALRVIHVNPTSGTGLGTYGRVSLIYQQHDIEHHYDQVHNDYLQLATDGGALLVIVVVAFVVLLGRDIRRQLQKTRGTPGWWLRAGAATSLIAIALQEVVDFSLQIPGNAALFVVVCAIALHDPPPSRPSTH